MQLDITSFDDGPGVLVAIDGEHLDAGNAAAFKALIQPCLDQHALVVVDMSRLRFVDSSGLGAMLSCLRHMNNKQGQLMLFALSKPVRSLFELVRMHRIFAIYNDLGEAMASVSR
ncbi:STAS domain-containing protein [Laribacter hongkongensis]|uniref:Anti-sigma factor antagonist n=1 Tax=Laribacter hongkongensis TaxID=168471 RepID=A0ABD4SWX7_9NEIS|nr:STAS domain-containing protein [Laribacter hongkongensis]MCG9027164.1 STAS domain-containing protein [Laribacter hongkongensis]MCG9032904.1 STAS domain-containing protein [Laribacter hongkongensis]MCG9092498.1 STAS domain-containing protein [Laribacter hongkongensis]MCG9094830.1 STAS domain-containing protein [Laribacter hongkongensis]MCG9100178.1 STAS domain-containing protein [Laribacter hongkongensis]